MNCKLSDVDECEVELHTCDPNAKCTNTLGSFDCECKSGYGGNGLSCQGSDCILQLSEFYHALVQIHIYIVLDSILIGSVLGTVAFLLIVGIVLVTICICCYVRRYSRATIKKTRDL